MEGRDGEREETVRIYHRDISEIAERGHIHCLAKTEKIRRALLEKKREIKNALSSNIEIIISRRKEKEFVRRTLRKLEKRRSTYIGERGWEVRQMSDRSSL